MSVVDDGTWAELLERDDYMCLYCNSEEDLQPAHYIARSHTGENKLDNLMLLCFKCHRMLHDGKLGVVKINGRFFFSITKK